MPQAKSHVINPAAHRVVMKTSEKFVIFFGAVLLHTTSVAQIKQPEDYITGNLIIHGKEAVLIKVPGTPPEGLRMPAAEPTESAVILNNVPAYDWSFGCSATSGAMMAGYYDNHGYPGIYTGPANGGIAPMNNSIWGTALINGEVRSLCHLSATRQGLDGRPDRGHVDDFWIVSGSNNPDPYITNGWTPHPYADCTGDFMKTNQSAFNNSDGSTIFTFYVDNSPFSAVSEGDGGYGLKLFFESKGCNVTRYFNQYIAGHGGNANGFTFEDYKDMIDMGMPVMIQVSGHTMLGVGYDNTGNTVILHDTWDYLNHSMTWGGTYAGMQHYAVTVIEFPCPLREEVVEDFGFFGYPACWSQSITGNLTNVRWNHTMSAQAGVTSGEMRADWVDETGVSRLISPPIHVEGMSHLNLSFVTFLDDFGSGLNLKIQSSPDLNTWNDESWSYATGNGDITAGTVINTQINNLSGDTLYIAWTMDGNHYQFDNWFIDNVSISGVGAEKQLQVKIFPEGLFNGTGLNPANNATGPQYLSGIADQITVELREASAPYLPATAPLSLSLNTEGVATASLPANLNAAYYIVVKHRNHLETWSMNPLSFSPSSIAYDFTDASSKAYGNNLKGVGGAWVMLAGDANQDGIVDAADLLFIKNQSDGFSQGYHPAVINGDGSVDAADLILTDNNAAGFAGAKHP
mgnify:CR=1 FL=1